MTATPILPGRPAEVTLRPSRPAQPQLAEVPSAYADDEPRRYLKHVERTGPLLPVGLRPPRWASLALWGIAVVGAGGLVLRLLVALF